LTTKDDPHAVQVELVDISSYVSTDPVFMKIDIDGYEVGALEGALKFMREKTLPKGYVEFNPHLWHRGDGISLERGVTVIQAMSDMGYSFSHLDGEVRILWMKSFLEYPLDEIVSGIRSSEADVQGNFDPNIYFSKEKSYY
jgi:hypothetical protein